MVTPPRGDLENRDRLGLRREAERHAALGTQGRLSPNQVPFVRSKVVSPLRFATAVKDARAVSGVEREPRTALAGVVRFVPLAKASYRLPQPKRLVIGQYTKNCFPMMFVAGNVPQARESKLFTVLSPITM